LLARRSGDSKKEIEKGLKIYSKYRNDDSTYYYTLIVKSYIDMSSGKIKETVIELERL
jgi:hypothetical protein